jgi:hypothetical protein
MGFREQKGGQIGDAFFQKGGQIGDEKGDKSGKNTNKKGNYFFIVALCLPLIYGNEKPSFENQPYTTQ